MDLTPYVHELRNQLLTAAEAGSDEARALAERLTAPLESSVRLILLEALAGAADEITRDLAPGSVEVRLRGGDPTFVVVPSPDDAFAGAPGIELAPVSVADPDDSGTARLNLRLPESLKARVEEAAGIEGLSLNAWLTRAAARALVDDPRRPSPRKATGGERYTGWVS